MDRFVGKGFYEKFMDSFSKDVRIKDSTCPNKKAFGSIAGDYNGVSFYITYDENKLVACIDGKEKETLQAMMPFLCGMVKGANPNFQYDCSIKNTGFNPKEAFVLEWSNRPEARSCELGMCEKSDWEFHPGVFPYVKVRNLSNYTGEPIYGINPGDLEDPIEAIDMAYDEDESLFCLMYGILRDIAENSYKMDEETLRKRNLALDFAKYQTKVMGLDVSEPKYGERIKHGKKFNEWFATNCRIFRRDNIIECDGVTQLKEGRVKTDLPTAPSA